MVTARAGEIGLSDLEAGELVVAELPEERRGLQVGQPDLSGAGGDRQFSIALRVESPISGCGGPGPRRPEWGAVDDLLDRASEQELGTEAASAGPENQQVVTPCGLAAQPRGRITADQL